LIPGSLRSQWSLVICHWSLVPAWMLGCMDAWSDWNVGAAPFGQINACGGKLLNPLQELLPSQSDK